MPLDLDSCQQAVALLHAVMETMPCAPLTVPLHKYQGGPRYELWLVTIQIEARKLGVWDCAVDSTAPDKDSFQQNDAKMLSLLATNLADHLQRMIEFQNIRSSADLLQRLNRRFGRDASDYFMANFRNLQPSGSLSFWIRMMLVLSELARAFSSSYIHKDVFAGQILRSLPDDLRAFRLNHWYYAEESRTCAQLAEVSRLAQAQQLLNGMVSLQQPSGQIESSLPQPVHPSTSSDPATQRSSQLTGSHLARQPAPSTSSGPGQQPHTSVSSQLSRRSPAPTSYQPLHHHAASTSSASAQPPAPANSYAPSALRAVPAPAREPSSSSARIRSSSSGSSQRSLPPSKRNRTDEHTPLTSPDESCYRSSGTEAEKELMSPPPPQDVVHKDIAAAMAISRFIEVPTRESANSNSSEQPMEEPSSSHSRLDPPVDDSSAAQQGTSELALSVWREDSLQAAVLASMGAPLPSTAYESEDQRCLSSRSAAAQIDRLPPSSSISGLSNVPAPSPSDLSEAPVAAGSSRRMRREQAGDADEQTEDDDQQTGGDNDPTELWCYCQEVESGEMIQCDNGECQTRWFHFNCAEVGSPPSGEWYCENCKKFGKAPQQQRQTQSGRMAMTTKQY